MTCQNCGSNDIIAIQSQNYCINCGQLVGAKGEPKGVAKFAVPIKTEAKKPAITPVKSMDGMAAPASADGSKKVSDIMPTKFGKKPNFDRKPLLDLKNPETTAIEDSPNGTTPKAHTLQFVSKLAAAIAVPLGLILTLALYFKLDTDVILYGAIAGGLVASLAIMVLQSALLYGGSKARDGRVVPESQWWTLAREHFTELLNINLISAVAAVVLALGAYGFWEMTQLIPENQQSLKMPTLMLANMFISWLALGLISVRRLTISIVSIGGVPATEACRMAWGMYQDFGGHLILSAAETAVIRLVAATSAFVIVFGAYMLAQSNAAYEPIAYGFAALSSILIWLVVFMRVEIAVWVSRYRWIAGQQSARVKSQLLAGTSTSSSS